MLLAFIQNISGTVNLPSKPPGILISLLLVKSVIPNDSGLVTVIFTPCFSPQAFHSASVAFAPGVVGASPFIFVRVTIASSITDLGTYPLILKAGLFNIELATSGLPFNNFLTSDRGTALPVTSPVNAKSASSFSLLLNFSYCSVISCNFCAPDLTNLVIPIGANDIAPPMVMSVNS